MKKLIILVLLFLSPIIAQTGKSVLSTAQINMIKGFISDSLLTRDQQIDSIFSLLGEAGISDVDSISIILTSSDPPKLQINVTWLDGRVDSLITTRIGQYTLDDLEDVLATTPDDQAILIYNQGTGFWETGALPPPGGSVSNADSLGGQPASAYVRKSDSTIIFATPSQLNSGLALKLNYDFSGYSEGVITNTDLLIYQDINSGTPRRITFSNFRSGLNIPSISGLATTIYVNQSVDSVRNQIDSVNITYPDVNTIQFSASGQALQLDPATLEIDQGILTVIGGGYTFDSTFVYQRLAEKLNITDTTAFRTFSDLKYLLSSALNTYWDSVAVKDYLAEILQGDSIIGGKATLDSLILAFWNDELGGGGGISQDSLNTKLYSSFNTEYPQVTTPSVDNYIPVLTGIGNHYAALDDLPISSAVSSALSGKQDALGFTPEDVSNKSIDTTLGTSNALYPSQNAVKTYVDNAIETVNNEGDPRVPYMWVYLALDTIPSLTSFTPVTDAERSTVTESDVIGVNTYDVSYVSITLGGTDATYRTKTGETWSNWVNTWQLLKAVDSAQVRFTSSDSYEDALACTLVVGGEQEIFTVTTVAEILPDAPTGFEAEGGTSDTEIPMTWTDAVGGIDSVRIYEGSTNDTTAMTWIASVVQGTEAYTRTGRTAETTYWYAARSLSGELLSSFSNTDSATTLSSGGDTLGTNILVNGDMETPFSGGYNVWDSRFGATVERSTEEVYAGDYSCKTITIGGGTGVTTQVQYIPLESGKSYWVEGYIYIVSGAAIVGATVSGYGGAVLDVTKDQWVYFKFKVDATATSTHRLYFEEYGAGGNTTFYLDNLSIKELL